MQRVRGSAAAIPSTAPPAAPPVTTAPEASPDSSTPDSANRDGGGSVYDRNCTAAKAAGAVPTHRGDPGYRPGLVRDGDGRPLRNATRPTNRRFGQTRNSGRSDLLHLRDLIGHRKVGAGSADYDFRLKTAKCADDGAAPTGLRAEGCWEAIGCRSGGRSGARSAGDATRAYRVARGVGPARPHKVSAAQRLPSFEGCGQLFIAMPNI